MYLACQCI